MICEKCKKQQNGTFGSGRFCSRGCANSRTYTIDMKKQKSIIIKEKIRKGLFKPVYSFKKGKLNPSYKENGSVRHNKENKNKTFDKYNGICQMCKKKINKNKPRTWIAHHKDLLLTIEQYNDSTNRILYCWSCHTKLHNKLFPKKHKYGMMRIR